MVDRKGNVLNWFVVLIILFAFVVCVFIAHIMLTAVDTTKVFASNTNAQYALDQSTKTILSFDNMFLFLIVGLSLFVLISSAFVFNHPAFFIVGFIMLCVAVTVAAIMSNAYWDFTQDVNIQPEVSAFPKIDFLMLRLPFYIAFMGMGCFVVAYIGYTRIQ